MSSALPPSARKTRTWPRRWAAGARRCVQRAFAAKLVKYAGWRTVAYRGKGVFDVDYHFEGRATQDFIFPALPDNDLIIPFIAIRRRIDGSVLVTAPAMTGGSGPIAARAGAAAASKMGSGGPQSRAEGRFTIITDGEILTNNSEDGAAPHPLGRQLHWDVGRARPKSPKRSSACSEPGPLVESAVARRRPRRHGWRQHRIRGI